MTYQFGNSFLAILLDSHLSSSSHLLGHIELGCYSGKQTDIPDQSIHLHILEYNIHNIYIAKLITMVRQ